MVMLLQIRRMILGAAILVSLSGILLFAISTAREVHTSAQTSWYSAPVQAGTFSYGAATLPLSNPSRETIIGTTGIADLIILTTAYQNFSEWVCHFVPPSDTYSRCVSFGGNYFNVTILYSYLQTHQSQIAYSQTIVSENITLSSIDYHVSSPTSVTIVLAHIGSGWVRDYGQTRVTNQTVSYPLIGYTERSGTSWTLSNVSGVLIISGSAGLIITLVRSKSQSLLEPRPDPGAVLRECPDCGRNNLYFGQECHHCGGILQKEMRRVEAASH